MFGKPESGPLCPLLKGACSEARCKWWNHIRGHNPQGGEIDLYDCTIRWLPVLLIEGSQMQRQTGAAVESLRNESVKSADTLARAVLIAAREAQAPRLAEREPPAAFLRHGDPDA